MIYCRLMQTLPKEESFWIATVTAVNVLLKLQYMRYGAVLLHRVWTGCSIALQKCSTNQLDFMQLFEFLLNKLSIDELELLLVQAWTI